MCGLPGFRFDGLRLGCLWDDGFYSVEDLGIIVEGLRVMKCFCFRKLDAVLGTATLHTSKP